MARLPQIGRIIENNTRIDAQGHEETTSLEKTFKIERTVEPEYIKLYTKMWCEFNQIPEGCRDLFLALVCRMTYCNIRDKVYKGGQIVITHSPICDDIMQSLGIKKARYQRILKELCNCNAIRQIKRGVYQINPSYAGKGEWKYNPKLDQGGIENLIATFNCKESTVDTQIIWADDGTNTALNETYRQGVQVRPEDNAVLTYTTVTPNNADAVPEFDNLTKESDRHETR